MQRVHGEVVPIITGREDMKHTNARCFSREYREQYCLWPPQKVSHIRRILVDGGYVVFANLPVLYIYEEPVESSEQELHLVNARNASFQAEYLVRNEPKYKDNAIARYRDILHEFYWRWKF